MPRRFRFRVKEGHQLHEYGGDRPKSHGPGYEFVLSEEDAARLLRERRTRHAYELVEVIAEDEPGEPPDVLGS